MKINWENFGAVVVLAGDAPRGLAVYMLEKLRLNNSRLKIIAADGGAAALAELGIEPHIIIGDNDSLPADLFPHIPRLLYPPAKDFTDGEAACAYAFRECKGDILLLGALGGRLDQELANIQLPLAYAEYACRFWLAGKAELACYSIGHTAVSGQPGDTLSIVPLTPLQGITLKGLVYPLQDHDLDLGSSRCISNVLQQSCCEISFVKGKALIIHYPQIKGQMPERNKE